MKSNDLAIVREIAYLKHFEFKSCLGKSFHGGEDGDGWQGSRTSKHTCMHVYFLEVVVDLRLSTRAKRYRFFAYLIGFEGVNRQISMILRAAEQAEYVLYLSNR